MRNYIKLTATPPPSLLYLRSHVLSAGPQQAFQCGVYNNKQYYQARTVESAKQHPPGHQDLHKGEEAAPWAVLSSPPRNI